MNRTVCPSCSCGFDENPTLFVDLTSMKVQQTLSKIKKRADFIIWLQDNGIRLERDGEDWKFPEGICKSVQNKLRAKIAELKIFDYSLGKQEDLTLPLLPASDPDDTPPDLKQITQQTGLLVFEEDGDFPLGTPWNYQQGAFVFEGE